MSEPFRLVAKVKDRATIEVLRDMIKAAENGELIGLAFVAMYERREYNIGYTGECARNPTYARGMIQDLMDDLGRSSHDHPAHL